MASGLFAGMCLHLSKILGRHRSHRLRIVLHPDFHNLQKNLEMISGNKVENVDKKHQITKGQLIKGQTLRGGRKKKEQ